MQVRVPRRWEPGSPARCDGGAPAAWRAVPSISSLSPASSPVGAGGTSVTVAGANFGSAGGAVTFNAAPVATSTFSHLAVTLVAPAQASVGTASVVVAAPGGAVSAAVSFAYFAVTPSSIGPSLARQSGGTLLVARGAGFVPEASAVLVFTAPCSGARSAAAAVGATISAASPSCVPSATAALVQCSVAPNGQQLFSVGNVRALVARQCVVRRCVSAWPARACVCPGDGVSGPGGDLALSALRDHCRRDGSTDSRLLLCHGVCVAADERDGHSDGMRAPKQQRRVVFRSQGRAPGSHGADAEHRSGGQRRGARVRARCCSVRVLCAAGVCRADAAPGADRRRHARGARRHRIHRYS